MIEISRSHFNHTIYTIRNKLQVESQSGSTLEKAKHLSMLGSISTLSLGSLIRSDTRSSAEGMECKYT